MQLSDIQKYIFWEFQTLQSNFQIGEIVAEYQFILSETQMFLVGLRDPTPQDAKCQLSF